MARRPDAGRDPALALVPPSRAGWAAIKAPGRAMRRALLLLVLSTSVLQHIGLTIGTASFSSSMLVLLVCLVAFGLAGRVVVRGPALVAYSALAFVVCAGAIVNASGGEHDAQSIPSMLLLLAMYLPLVFGLRPPHDSGIDAAWLRRVMADVMLFCAVVGIAQFVLQFFVHSYSLFNYGPLLPSFLRSPGGYNTVYAMGDVIKANGFFFKEPSFFSLAMAFGLLLEIAEFRRAHRMALMVIALLLTYSGSGFVVLAVGLLLPLRLRTLARLGVVVLIGALAALVLWDVLNLEFTVARVTEFDDPRTSGYQRYVAPVRLLVDSAFDRPWSLLLGHGPGTMTRSGDATFYAFHDPTFAKAIYEYGLLGLIAFVALCLSVLWGAPAPFSLRAAAFACWLGTGGFLLTPEMLYLVLIFGHLLPGPARPAAEASDSRRHVDKGRAAPRAAVPLDLTPIQPR